MTIMEMILLIIGIVAFVASFRIPVSREEKIEGQFPEAEEEIQKLVKIQVDEAASRITDSVDETVNLAADQAQRSMEKLTNEKIMAINEYADSVLGDIHKNHEEVVFMYDMLNDKQTTLKNTVREVEQTAKSVTKAAQEARQTAQTAEETAQTAEETAQTAVEMAQTAVETVQKAVETVQESMAAVPDKREEAFRPLVIQEMPVGAADTMQELISSDINEQKKSASKAVKKKKAEEQADEKAAKGILPVPELITTDTPEGENTERNRNDEILALHKAGKSNMAIARELGLGVGEVKLVIDLFKGI